MIRVKTRNSVYEIDEEAKLVRRAECEAENFQHSLSHGEWEPYTEWYEFSTGNMLFRLANGRSTITSTVQSIDEDVH